MKYCMKHPDRPATHTLKSGDDTFLLCEICGRNAVANGAHSEPYLGNVVENPRFPPEGERIAKAIQVAFQAEIEEAVKVALKNAHAELDRRVPEIVAGLALRLMERITMDRLDRELVIHVRMDDNRKT